jgi:hypothetical protein
MTKIGREVLIIGGTALAVWALHRLWPEAGRVVSLVGSIAFLVALLALLVRRLQQTERVPLLPDNDEPRKGT